MRRAALVLLLVAACRPKAQARPDAVDAEPPIVANSAVVPLPALPAPPPPPPELSADATERVERWRRKLEKQMLAHPPPPGGTWSSDLTTGNERHGAFDLITATIPVPIMAGGAEGSHEMLVLTAAGEVALGNAPVFAGLADVNGDGREDVFFEDATVIADMTNGPMPLKVAAKGGAFGWRHVRTGEHEGKPVLVGTTETNTSRETGAARSGGYFAFATKGVREEVTLQWDGKKLAQVARRPLETKEEADARARLFAVYNRVEDARMEGKSTPCERDCMAKECTVDDPDAPCLATCVRDVCK